MCPMVSIKALYSFLRIVTVPVAWENDNRNFVNFLEVLKMVIKDDKLGEF